MMINPVILKLTPEETLRLTRILMDEDKEEAFLFLKECLKPQLDQAAVAIWYGVLRRGNSWTEKSGGSFSFSFSTY
jgi:hypothetical protein